jgi:hypothetical protein
MVVQVLACDAAIFGNGLYVLLQGGGSVDEQVAPVALEQESADLQRGAETQRLGRRSVEPGYDGFHNWFPLFSTFARSTVTGSLTPTRSESRPATGEKMA